MSTVELKIETNLNLFTGATIEDGELVRVLFNSVGVCEMVPEYQQVINLIFFAA